jgi:hypothetical protein
MPSNSIALLSLFILLLFSAKTVLTMHDITCHDPDVGGTIQNKDRKFLLIGSPSAGGAGMGNLLVFFPAAFYFAAVTGRDIVIQDGSIIGDMCSIITCGFPFLDQLKYAFPMLLNDETLSRVPEIKAADMSKFMDGNREINEPVVRASGYQPKSDWWLWYNTTLYCVKKLTGCDLGDVSCTERHAFQRLIRGPFKSSLTDKEEKRIIGIPDNFKHAILTVPHAYAPRLDFAIHLRNQFHHFEGGEKGDNPDFVNEVKQWLDGQECKDIFDSLLNMIIGRMDEIRPPSASITIATEPKQQQMQQQQQQQPEETKEAPFFMYLAADNAQVKHALSEKIANHSRTQGRLHVMQLNASHIYHVKNYATLKKETNNEGLMDLVFDWY